MNERPGAKSESGYLPVPYKNPWVLLRETLNAVGVDLWLRLRLLWRRNRQGDLYLPRFLPVEMASLFWPLVLAIVLTLIGSLAWSMLSSWEQTDAVSQMTSANAVNTSNNDITDENIISGSSLDSRLSSLNNSLDNPVSGSSLNGTSMMSNELPFLAERHDVVPPVESSIDASSTTNLSPEIDLESEGESLSLDPLLLPFLDAEGSEHLLDIAETRPQVNGVSLQLTSIWWELSSIRRQELANVWLVEAEALGYDDLRLFDQDGRLLAKTAQVGQGMIVFEGAVS